MIIRLLLVAAVALAAVFGYLLLTSDTYQAPEAEAPSTVPPVALPPQLPQLEGLPLRRGEAPSTYVVLMRNEGGRFFFDPAALHVEPGDTVIWFNLGDNHSTTAYAPPNKKAGGVVVPQRIPEGAQAWDSGILGIQDRGLTFRYTFEVSGTYDYFCFPHEFLGMVGRIVTDAPGGPAESAGAEGLSDDAAQALAALPSAQIVSPEGGRFTWAAEINAVLLKAFEKDSAGALDQAQWLLEHADQAAALVSDARAFQQGLTDLVQLVQSGAGFGPLSQQADALKALLGTL